MIYLWIFIGIGAALVFAIIGRVVGARYRRFDAVPNLTDLTSHSGAPQHSVTMIARPQEITEMKLERSRAYDASEDVLDPHHPHHAQWLGEHEPSPASTEDPEAPSA